MHDFRHQAYAGHALAQYELGLAFHNRVNGEPRSNLEAAVAEYDKSLEVF